MIFMNWLKNIADSLQDAKDYCDSKISTTVSAVGSVVVLKGDWDASTGVFPGSINQKAGWSYIVSVGGTVDGVVFTVNDRLIAIADNASTTTFAGNWFKADYTDNVLSVNSRVGAVTGLMEATDFTASAIKTLLGITTLSGSNTGDATTTTLGTLIAGATSKATPVDADSIALMDSANSNILVKLSWANLKAGLKTYFDGFYLTNSQVSQVLHVRDQRTAGTAGQSLTAGAWTQRTLQTVIRNDISGASLASNQITLPAGTYDIRASSPCHESGIASAYHKIRIRNITGGTTLVVGGNEFITVVNAGTTVGTTAKAEARIVLAGSTIIELNHYTTDTAQNIATGAGAAEVEVYSEVFIVKVA